jgi:hypothetical protein
MTSFCVDFFGFTVKEKLRQTSDFDENYITQRTPRLGGAISGSFITSEPQ